MTKNYYSVLAVTGFLIVIQCGLVLKRIQEPLTLNLVGTSVLSWAIVLLLIHRNKLRLSSNLFSSVLGITSVIGILIASAFLHNYVPFLRIVPLISALGIISQIQKPSECWQELIVLCVLAIPESITNLLVYLPVLTAKTTALVLLSLGFDVSQQGVYVFLPTGSVEVNEGCSGAKQMFQLFRLAISFLVLFPTQLTEKLWVKILVPVTGVLLAFIVNIVRVSYLTVLVASFNKKAFAYWHTSEGSHLISTIPVIIFSLLYYFILLRELPEKKGRSPLAPLTSIPPRPP